MCVFKSLIKEASVLVGSEKEGGSRSERGPERYQVVWGVGVVLGACCLVST